MGKASHDQDQTTLAEIDLGNSQVVEITRSTLKVSSAERPRHPEPSGQRADQLAELALELSKSQAALCEIERAAADLGPTGIDDAVVEILVSRGVELIDKDSESAYYILRLAYALSRRWATLWKHALVSSILGFLILRHRASPEEAIPVFEDLGITGRILGSYLGSLDCFENLCQLGGEGLSEACRALGLANDFAAANDNVAERTWSLLMEFSRGIDEGQWFMQSEAVVRSVLCLSASGDDRAAEHLAEIGRSYIASVGVDGVGISPAGCLRVFALAEVLMESGASAQALKLLETMQAACKALSPLMQAIFVNRKVAALRSLGRLDAAQELLDSNSLEALEGLSGASLCAQGEWLLYSIGRAEGEMFKGNRGEARRWVKEGLRQLQSLQQWDQMASLVRADDLRLLHLAILRNAANARLASLPN